MEKRIVLKALLAAMLCLTLQTFASSLKVTENPLDAGQYQIWIEAEGYDAKTAEFVVATDVTGASGDALYCPTVSDSTDLQQWWIEYSIDSADASLSGITLDGTWYCWVRATQPTADDEDADWLIVRDDADDGTGTAWYTDALATLLESDDRIADDLQNRNAVGQWAWIGGDTTNKGLEKEFTVGTDGKIIFRINERQAGPGNARIDAICWSNDPNYVPVDKNADNKWDVARDVIVLDMDAAQAGSQTNTNWEPVVGHNGGGEILDFTDPACGTHHSPYLVREDDTANAGKYNWFYRFTAEAPAGDASHLGGAGEVGGLADLGYDYDDNFAVEVWYRATGPSPEEGTQPRGILVSNQLNGNGWYMDVKKINDTPTQTYFVEFAMRDATGDQKSTFTSNGGWMGAFDNEWQHVVINHIGTTDDYPEHKWFINGTSGAQRTTSPQGTWDFTETDFVPAQDQSALGGKNYQEIKDSSFRYDNHNFLWFAGDIAAVRVYNRNLNFAEVQTLYANGINSYTETQCGGGLTGDLNGDCIVDLQDFAVTATEWLNCTLTPLSYCP